MTAEITFLFMGTVLGLSAGFSPGPLLTLVVSESLKYGKSEGMKVALSPLITDVPIVAATIFLLSRLPDIQIILGIISFAGAVFLIHLGWENIRFGGMNLDAASVKPQSLKKGIVANFLSPNPYLFWLTIGAPTAIKASDAGFLPPSLFLLGFYICLVGAKVIVAVVIGSSRQFLKSRIYIWINRFLGALLLVFAVMFLWDGIKFLF
ncbi:MAG: LysE family translocator [Candidatus Omnitrophota bacterium]|jgi:threonine/homoserine/homoserine lactone efflux protein|nr:MAG: LysE family translocator [Candidatus Omnitrophota bacterium]